jgi:hypothetical protein
LETLDFSTGYQVPGVYIEKSATGSVAAVGAGATVLCLVGTGLGYETNTEYISFASGSTVALAKKGVVVDGNLVLTAELDSGHTVFVIDNGSTQHDYAVSTTSGVTSITRHNSGTIPVDRPVKVTYRFTDDAYYSLNRFDDDSTLMGIYGSPLDPSTGAIVSPISFAAQAAFRNNANVIFTVALDLRGAVNPASPTSQELQDAWSVAYNKIIPNYEINLVVPLWAEVDDTSAAETYLSDLSAFLTTAETEGFPMMAITGVAAGYATFDPDVLAASVANSRVVIVWPQKMYYFNSLQNRGTTECDGFYLAAACAGVLAGQSPNRGLTQSQISGFTGIPADVLNQMTTSKKNGWSSKGVSVAEINRSSQIVIRQGLTTDVSRIDKREISIVRCLDVVIEGLQLTLESAQMIGDPITPDTPLQIAGLVDGALQANLLDDIISDYTSPLVTQAPDPQNNPTVIKVTFSLKPIYPVDYIDVSLTVDLTTSAITSSTDLTDPTNNASV